MQIPTDKILPNPMQPRRVFGAAELQELADSIREVGLINPIVVVKSGEWYVLVDGERRWRACKLLGMPEIRADVREENLEQDKLLIQALVANVRRTDLSPIEEARAYHTMKTVMLMSNVEIAKRAGINCMRVAHRLQLLELPEDLREMIGSGKIPVDRRVVEAILSIPEEYRMEFANKIQGKGLSIAQIQKIAGNLVSLLAKKAAPPGQQLDVPAVDLAKHDHPASRWDMLAQAGVMPAWRIVVNSARKTCRDCGWGDMSSREICSDCPAVQFVTLMNQRAEEYGNGN